MLGFPGIDLNAFGEFESLIEFAGVELCLFTELELLFFRLSDIVLYSFE